MASRPVYTKATSDSPSNTATIIRTETTTASLHPFIPQNYLEGDGPARSVSAFSDAKEYLHPIELDEWILGEYLRVLLTDRNAPQGFLHLLAVHYVAGPTKDCVDR